MKELNTLLKNFSSSFIGSLIGNIFGFALLLYLPNVLGVEKYGIYNFAISFNAYFLMLTDLGISMYSIKYINSNQRNIEKFINKIFSLKLWLGVIGFFISIFLLCIMKVDNEKLFFTLIINLSIIATSFCVDYLFNAYNQMKFSAYNAVIKNVLLYVLCLIFVRHESDIYKLAIIYTLSLFAASIILLKLFNHINYKIKLEVVKLNDFNLIKSTFPLAISLIMIQINNNFDILYLSINKGDLAVGIYSAAYKIINFLITLLVVYFNSAYPTISQLYYHDEKQLENYLQKFFKWGLILVLPMTVGGLIIGDKIINFIYDSNYTLAIGVFEILIILILIRFISSTYGSILLMGKNAKFYTIAVVIGATINVFLNILLTPAFSYYGCAIATIISELIQLFIFFYYFKKELSVNFFKGTINIFVSTLLMSFFIGRIKGNFSLIFIIIVGGLIYGISFVFCYKLQIKFQNRSLI